jgi:STE24 endopeptidase
MISEADRRWVRALAAALALAEAAALALRPHDGLLDARQVDARAHFDADEMTRARRYGLGQLALGGAGALAEGTLLVTLLRRDRRRGRAGAGGLPAAGWGGATLSLGLAIVPLPFGALMRSRALAAGLATQSWRGWAVDVARSAALAAAFAAAGSVVVSALMRRFGPRWWAPAAAGSVGVAVVVTLVGPIALEPLFNDFTALPDGELRREVLELARRSGVRVGGVYEVDASRRTSAANAYVSGLGATRRVVLFDTLLATLPAAEARVVVAHELAHVAHRDVPRLLVFLAAAAPGGTRAVARLAERLEGSESPGLPSLALAGGAVSTVLGVVARQLSRAVERRADAFSLDLTGDPEAFVAFERRITRQNLADPDPPRWLLRLLGTHPPIVERIGIAAAYAAGERPTRRRRRRARSRRIQAGS